MLHYISGYRKQDIKQALNFNKNAAKCVGPMEMHRKYKRVLSNGPICLIFCATQIAFTNTLILSSVCLSTNQTDYAIKY
jgi:hypothetical protein